MKVAVEVVAQGLGVSLVFLFLHYLLVRRFDNSLSRSVRTLPWRQVWNPRSRWLGRRRKAVWQVFWFNAMTSAALAIAGGVLVSLSITATFDQPSIVPATIIVGTVYLLAEIVHERLLRRWVRKQRRSGRSHRHKDGEGAAHRPVVQGETPLPGG